MKLKHSKPNLSWNSRFILLQFQGESTKNTIDRRQASTCSFSSSLTPSFPTGNSISWQLNQQIASWFCSLCRLSVKWKLSNLEISKWMSWGEIENRTQSEDYCLMWFYYAFFFFLFLGLVILVINIKFFVICVCTNTVTVSLIRFFTSSSSLDMPLLFRKRYENLNWFWY